MTAVLFLIALSSLAASPIFVRIASAPIEFLGFWRLALAGILFLFWELARHGIIRLQLRQVSSWKWTLLAGFFFFLHLWTYVASAQNTSVAHLVILFSTNPIFTALGAAFFFRERLKRRLWLAYPLALAGLWILASEKVEHVPNSNYGDMMAVLSAALHAAYLLSSKQARRFFPNIPFSVGLYLVAAALFGFVALWRDPSSLTLTSVSAWSGVAGLILFPTFLGHALMTTLVNRMDLSLLSCGKLLEPGISSALAAVFLHEALGPNAPLAFLLTSAAVLIVVWPKKWNFIFLSKEL